MNAVTPSCDLFHSDVSQASIFVEFDISTAPRTVGSINPVCLLCDKRAGAVSSSVTMGYGVEIFLGACPSTLARVGPLPKFGWPASQPEGGATLASSSGESHHGSGKEATRKFGDR
ncbi:hypothetical protein THAOC_15715 [Thalassiosira oceanica]|uniref:Uncharacterized protein n=1 Tax=Thalassiosira oceanica TaxID=159749 RepID=K0SE23_THAOC|nr:hypothetical protein THAOC_15715 [Thalassiosira oceanica]|eukprot:EJK63615.1 hypothetical protein THAOC_15715 [Thalassiosira oceanica]